MGLVMTEEKVTNRILGLVETIRKAREGDFSVCIESSGRNDALDLLADEIRQLVTIVQERISEHTAAEEMQRECEERYRRLQANIPGMVYTFAQHPDGSFSFPSVNETSRDLFDIAPEDLMADASLITSLIHPDDREKFYSSVKRSAETLQPWREVLRHVVNGEVRWYDCISRPELQANGDILWDGMILEVTECMRAAEDLKKNEERMRLYFERQVVGMAITAPDKGWLQVNEKLCQMLGYERDELERLKWTELTHPADLEEDRAFFERLLKGEIDDYSLEKRFIRRDGTIVYAHLSVGCVRAATGSVDYVLALLEDVTERKRAEDVLKLSQFIIDKASIGIFQGGADGRILAVNEYWAGLLGYTPEELCTMNFFDIDPNLTPAAWREHRNKLTATGFNTFESVHRRKDGSTFPVEVMVNYLKFGEREFSCSFARDITERKKNDEALRQANLIVENSPAVLFRWRAAEGWPVEVVSKNVTRFGYSAEELLSGTVPYSSLVYHQDLERVVAEIEDHVRRGSDHFQQEYRIVTKHGEVRWIDDRTVVERDADGRVTHYQGIVLDISDRKQIEQQLRFTQFAIDKSIDQAFWMTEDSQLFYVNDAACRALGYTRQELEGMSIPDIDPICQAELFAEYWQNLRKNGSATFESLHRAKDGRIYPVEIRANYVVFDGKEYNCAFATDISGRKQAEEALRESEQKFRVLAETAPAAIVVYQGENFVYVNKSAVRLFGYRETELLEMKFWEWAHPEDREIVMNRGLARQGGEPGPIQYQHRFVNKAGEDGWVMISAGTIEYRGKPAGIATFVDITETKRAEERVKAALAEKVILLKEVHHRVKNNLQIISSLLELQSDYIHEGDSRRYIAESQGRIRSMALVHEQLYRSEDLSLICFARYVNDLVEHLRHSSLGNGGNICTEVDIRDIELGIDEAIPCGLITNELVSNALKHAFPDGRTGIVRICGAMDEEGYVNLSVSDNGVGFPPGFDLSASESLGLQIVSLLTQQLYGTIDINGDDGVTVALRFKSKAG
jgi:PAS domain S-box-containing protein